MGCAGPYMDCGPWATRACPKVIPSGPTDLCVLTWCSRSQVTSPWIVSTSFCSMSLCSTHSCLLTHLWHIGTDCFCAFKINSRRISILPGLLCPLELSPEGLCQPGPWNKPKYTLWKSKDRVWQSHPSLMLGLPKTKTTFHYAGQFWEAFSYNSTTTSTEKLHKPTPGFLWKLFVEWPGLHLHFMAHCCLLGPDRPTTWHKTLYGVHWRSNSWRW